MTLSNVAARAAHELAAQTINNTRWVLNSRPEVLESIAALLQAEAEKLRGETVPS